MNDTDFPFSENYFQESLTGPQLLQEDPNELEALFEGGDDVRFCTFTVVKNAFYETTRHLLNKLHII